jgi:hypothetical protein
MALDSNIVGALSGTGADVNASRQLMIVPETNAADNADNVGTIRIFGENDAGQLTGSADLFSPEIDVDYRMRVAQDLILDDEVFNYTAQNTGKHLYQNTTMTAAWSAGNLTINASSITTTTTGAQVATYACFPNNGTNTLSADVELAFSSQPQTNVFIEFGLGIPGSQTTAPTDGVFLRLSSAGLQMVTSNNGTETIIPAPLADGAGVWAYTMGKKYQFIIYQGMTKAVFWVNDGTGAVELGSIPLPTSQGRMTMSQGLQFFVKQRITGGAAGGVIQTQVGAYCVRLGGSNLTSTFSTQGNRIYGSYQGASGGTMGGLATYVNSTNPTAAAPSNTALTANLPAGLGGQGAVIAAVAAATDGIWSSYQVPALTVNIAGRRLVLRGLKLDLVNLGAAVATTATTIQFSLAFGHTNVSLATTEAAAAKAPRRLPIGIATWPIGAAIGAGPQSGPIFLDLGDAPVFVNPGEFVALVGKFLVGTATASQVINFTYTPIYGWE